MNIGDKVIGVWGAMHAEDLGEIVKVNYDDTVTILWENGAVKTMNPTEIRDDYFDPKGTPIGVYYNV